MAYNNEDQVTVRWTHHATSPAARLATFGSRVLVRPVIAMWARHPQWPWPYGLLELLAAVLPAVRGVERTRVRLPRCRAERQRPAGFVQGAAEPQAILYLHGGAFIVGGINSHRRLVSRIVKATGVPALAVGYRQLPKTSITTSLDDCLDGLRYLIDSGIEPRNVAVVGDSAGGYLALRVAMEAQRRGIGKLGAIGCMSPIIDLDPRAKLAVPGSSRDPLFPPEALTTIWSLIQAKEEDESALEGLRSPALASSTELAQLPPLLIQVGSEEILRTDAETSVALSAAAGGNARIQVFNGQIHVFQAGADIIPEGRLAIQQLSAHIVTSLARQQARAA